MYVGCVGWFSLSVPLLDKVSVVSFPRMAEWALTLCMCIRCGVQYIWRMMAAIRSLYGWWCCKVGCCK